jgi:hypothetical protein
LVAKPENLKLEVKFMATKSARTVELEEAIAQAVATLDEADGSRVGMSEAFDSARETLGDAFGKGFEDAVSEYLSAQSDEDDEDDDEDDDDDE